MSTSNADKILKVICPECKIYISYTIEEMKKGVKDNNLHCKICGKGIPISINYFKNTL